MHISNKLDRYINRAQRRKGLVHLLRTLAVIVLVVLAITAITVLLGGRVGYLDKIVNAARGFLILGPVFVCVVLLVWPLVQLRRNRGVDLLETPATEFDGRIETYVELRDGYSPREPRQSTRHVVTSDNYQASTGPQGFTELLAGDATQIANRTPLSKVVSHWQWFLPLLVILAAVGGSYHFLQNAAQTTVNGVRHVWTGWYTPGLIRERTIVVSPGSIEILDGDNAQIVAHIEGFETDELTLDVRDPEAGSDAPWRSTQLQLSDNGAFDYTLYRISEDLQYRLVSGFTESEVFDIEVVARARLISAKMRITPPQWTQRSTLESDALDDVLAPLESRVDFEIETDKPLIDGFLAVGEEVVALQAVDANSSEAESGVFLYRTELEISDNAEFQFADRLLGRRIDISRAYRIVIEQDKPPEIEFIKPARDISITPVEEAIVALQASDDFAIESLVLHYSVNAGEWQSIELDPDQQSNEYIFFAESLGSEPVSYTHLRAPRDS